MTKQQVKDNIDQDIRLKSSANSISPENVGKNMKDVVDLIPDLTNQSLIDSVNLNLSWKNRNTVKLKSASEYSVGVQTDWVFTRNGFIYIDEKAAELQYDGINITSKEPPVFQVNDIKNLLINVKDYAKIKDFSPKLVITKYKPSKRKGSSTDRTSGFKSSNENSPFKPSRILLKGIDNIVDFGQEYYFYISNGNNRLEAKGMGGRYSISQRAKELRWEAASAYVYLQLSLSITVNRIEYISKQTITLKMTLDGIKDDLGMYVNSTINFKYS